jgi:hypothetical protein
VVSRLADIQKFRNAIGGTDNMNEFVKQYVEEWLSGEIRKLQ